MNLFDKIKNEMLSPQEVTKEVNESIISKSKTFLTSLSNMLKNKIGQAKLFIKKIKNKIFVFYKKGQETGIVDQTNKEVAAKWAGSHSHMTFMINPKIKSVKESVKSNIYNKMLSEMLTSDEYLLDEARTAKEIGNAASSALSNIGAELQDLPGEPDEDVTAGIGEAKVNFDDLALLLEELSLSLKFRKNFSDRVPSLLLLGPPGAGKTSIIKKFAKDEGFNLKILEVASLYKEVLGGFPIIEESFSPNKTDIADKLSDLQKKNKSDLTKDEKDFINKFSKEYKDFVVNLKATSALPPSGDGGKWLLFLDEFNRDSDKMGAAMNLVLTGNIGTSYVLPLKTLVVASGNVGADFDGTNVQEMDTSTWDRFSRRVILQYDWLSWLKFSEEEFSHLNMGKTPAVIRNFVARTTKEKGKDDWTIDLKQFDPDAKARLTPRTMSEFAEAMMLAAKNDWIRNRLVGKHDKKFYEDNYKKKGFPSPEAYYLYMNQMSRHLLGRVADQVFGPDSADMVVDMIVGVAKTKEETQGSIEDVLMNWTNMREGGKRAVPTKMANEFTLRIPNILKSFKTASSFKKAMKAKGYKIPDELDGDAAVWAAVNIHNFLKDSKLGLDAATGIAKDLSELRSVNESTSEKNKKPVKNVFLDQVLTFLIKESKLFSDAWNTVAEAIDAEKIAASELKLAHKLADKNRLITGPAPKYVSSNLSDRDFKNYLFITNMQMLEPKIIRRILSKKKKKKMNEELRNLFDQIGIK